MAPEQLTQSLKLTIQELVSKLSDELTAKHVLAVQLVEKEEEVNRLQAENEELQALLDQHTSPEGGN